MKQFVVRLTRDECTLGEAIVAGPIGTGQDALLAQALLQCHAD